MKIKTRDLTKITLDWAVAKCNNAHGDWVDPAHFKSTHAMGMFNHSSSAKQCQPIVERERISCQNKHDGWWLACIYDINDDPQHYQLSHSKMEAEMRCYVASQLGESVEVPDLLAMPSKDMGADGSQTVTAGAVAGVERDLSETVREQAAEIARLRAVVQEVNNWVVCSAIATPEDMAGNFERIEEITRPDYAGDDSELLFEVIGFGFDGGTDETDDRVLWVTAPSIEVVETAVAGFGARVSHLGHVPDEVGMDEVDFRLPKDTAELQAKCQHFQTCDADERLRRIQNLPNLQKSAGATYTFLQVANKAISDAIAVGGKVDWHQVESDTINVSVLQNGQRPADVQATLLHHSPGAVGVGCRDGSIAGRIAAAEESLRNSSTVPSPSEPTI